MADSLDSVRDRLNRLRRDFGLENKDKEAKENVTGSLTNTMDPTAWLNRITDAGNKPEDWLDYLYYLEHRGQFVDLTNKYRTMWSAYNRAMKNITLDLYRHNKAYAQIVVKFAWLKETENVDDARLLFKFARGNIKPFAFVHVAAAQLERKHNDIEKCVSILKKARDIGAQPGEMLDTALERCYAGESSLITPPADSSNGSKPVTRMEIDTPRPCPKAKTPPEPQRMEVDMKSEVLDQSKVDSTVCFNLPEKRSRNPSTNSNSDEADTIPWLNNKFNTFNQQMPVRTNHAVPSSNPRLAHTVSKSVRSNSLVTPNCKTQSMSSTSVGGTSRRRPLRTNLGAATRIRLTSHQHQQQPQQSSQDDSDDDDSYFVDFKPLGKISPPTETKPPLPALHAIAEHSNSGSMDSGVGLTPLEEKARPSYPNDTKPTDQPAPPPAPTPQDTSPFSVHSISQHPNKAPAPSQPQLVVMPVTASSLQTTPATVVDSKPAPAPSANKEHADAARGPENAPFVPPRMPARKSKDTITVNGKHYSILRTIGKGGSSKVFEAFSEEKKVLAIKSVNLEYADEMTIKGYLNEITLLHKLRKSDHIIRLYDYEVTDNHLAIVMERGSVDLSTFLKKNKNINGEKIKFYWMEMLEAVEVVHKEDIIHSDLKPANFLFVEGKLKLIDFGIANAIQADMTSVVKESQVGTLNYMSPEAIQDTSATPQVDARGHRRPRLKINCKSDVWSLGCILYYMVYGHTPFQRITNTLVKLQAICDPQHEIKFPDLENKLLLDTLKKCMIRDPRNRPSIQELLQHPYLNSNVQPATEVAPDKNVQSLIAQLSQLSSPNTVLKTLQRVVMEQQVAKNSSKEQQQQPQLQQPQQLFFSQQPPSAPQPVSHSTNPYTTSGMHHQQYQQPAPPVSSGMIPTSYSSTSAFHNPHNIISEPLRPIARAPLQALNMDDLQRAQSNQQAPMQTNGTKYMTQQEKENKDLESVLRRQLSQKYQPAQSHHVDASSEQTWAPQTMK